MAVRLYQFQMSEIPIESLAGSVEGDDIPVHSFDDVPVDDMEGSLCIILGWYAPPSIR